MSRQNYGDETLKREAIRYCHQQLSLYPCNKEPIGGSQILKISQHI